MTPALIKMETMKKMVIAMTLILANRQFIVISIIKLQVKDELTVTAKIQSLHMPKSQPC